MNVGQIKWTLNGRNRRTLTEEALPEEPAEETVEEAAEEPEEVIAEEVPAEEPEVTEEVPAEEPEEVIVEEVPEEEPVQVVEEEPEVPAEEPVQVIEEEPEVIEEAPAEEPETVVEEVTEETAEEPAQAVEEAPEEAPEEVIVEEVTEETAEEPAQEAAPVQEETPAPAAEKPEEVIEETVEETAPVNEAGVSGYDDQKCPVTMEKAGRLTFTVTLTGGGGYAFVQNGDWWAYPEEGTTTYNVDLIKGSYSVNVNAGENVHCKITYTKTYAGESFPEPNDSYSNASASVINKTYTGHMAKNEEKDVYKLKLAKSGRIKLTVDSQVRKMYMHLTCAPNNNESQVWNWIYPEQGKTTYYLDLKAGTYYLYFQKSDGTGVYKFTTVFTDSNESFPESLTKNNDTFSSASASVVNKAYTGQIAMNDEYDSYKMKLKKPGRVKITLNSQISNVDIFVTRVINNSEDRVWGDYVYPAKGKSSYILDLVAGSYYLYFRRYDGKTGTYKFQTKYVAAGETFKETNNTYSAASKLTAGKKITGHLAINDEQDVYKIKVPKGGSLKIVYSTKQIASADINIYRDNNNSEDYIYEYFYPKKNTTTYTTKPLEGGTYYIHVKRDRTEPQYLGAYTLTVTKSKGWFKVDGKWYYAGSDFKVKKGWFKVKKKWYYANTDGVMQTGWQTIKNKRYYFGTDGIMVTGWKKVSSDWYYFGSDGVAASGWKKLGGKWYYFSTYSYYMYANGRYYIDGKYYRFNKSGVLIG